VLIDLCVPTRHSPDSSIDPAEAVRVAAERGLDGIAFADADTIAAREEIRSLRAEAPIAVFFGVRISTDHGELLCFFRDPDATPAPEELLGPRPDAGWPVREVLARVREARGAAIAARPYDHELSRPMGDSVFTLEGLAAVEALSGRLSEAANEQAILAASHLDLPCVGASGARTTQEIGRAATLFRDEFAGQRSLVEALEAGNVWAVWLGTPPSFPGDQAARREVRSRRLRGRRGGGRR